MSTATPLPAASFFDSQGLRLHYADWGNPGAPPLLLVHGARDHCRSWDAIARDLRTHFHVLAPDLRGHGDSDWAKASSYSLADHVYDLTRLSAHAGLNEVTIVGHSMGGMVGLMYAGTYPEKVARLAVLDGVTVAPGRTVRPIHEQIAAWVKDLDRIAARTPRRFESIAQAAERMQAHNRRMSFEQALAHARHAVKQNADGSYSWKFDPYQQAWAPYRIAAEDHAALWSRIACPVMLMRGEESELPDPAKTGALAHFRNVRTVSIAGAGHWLYLDRLDEVLRGLRAFLGLDDAPAGRPSASA